ncbi:S8 family peptidase [Umezawaea beigongshangensis]|uniref:S8 family peptidase n=1 Tax=Umezawaea beigongshangensis TaxID=2780383 RepID=UPI0018F190CF|nr:S8 family serine peptidase [Umezawaea beigongshangensis]
MRHHRLNRPTGVGAALGVALLTTALTAPGAQAAPEPGAVLAEPLPNSATEVVHTGSSERIGATLARATGTVTAFVELAETPAVEAFSDERARSADLGAATEAAKRTRVRSAEKAERVLEVLRDKDSATREVAKTANAVAGLVVSADAAGVRELVALPEVRSVRLSVPKVVQNASSVQLTRAVQVWQRTGRLGEGMRIGVVDTGVDYTHADFGGPGTPEAYDAVDRTTVDPSFFPTAKVVGGYDFAGDDYDAGTPESSVPKPDPNPLDCNSHGTHVAGSAAGLGENADGSTFTGDHSALTPEALDAMRIGPGSAPKAQLYALKVFGCTGSTNLTGQALDWTLDPNGDGDFSDHLDVVNLSLGTDYGAQDDPDNLFVRELTAHGVLVVAAAGNGGDFYDVGGSPANTPEALAVANSRDAFALLDGVEIPDLGDRPGQYGQSYTGYETLDLTRPVVPMTDAENLDGCTAFSPADAAAVADKFVWLEWDDVDATRACGSGARVDNAEAAGAAGVILTSTRDNFLAGIAGNANIPTFQFTGTATAGQRPALQAGALRVRMTGALRRSVPTTTPKLADTITPSSARGSRGPVAAKPDVSAPGDTIVSAHVGTGDSGVSMGGTSMAAPHVAGIAALVREAHPEWTPEEVKASVMNTAGGTVTSGDDNTTGLPEAPMRVGAGRVDAKAAVDNRVLAMVDDEPGAVGVSFGPVEIDGPTTATKTVRVLNRSDHTVRVDARYAAATTVPGVSFDLSRWSLRVPAGGEDRIRVRFRVVDPAALRKVADPTVVKQQSGVARQFLAEASGRLVLTPDDGGSVLRVPVYAAPKPTASISASPLFFRGGGSAELTLSGRGLAQGEGDAAYRSLVSVFELQGTSGRLPDCGDGVATDCAINQTARGGDLRYVGVASTAPQERAAGTPDEALLAFGVATWNNWANLGSTTTPEIRVDTTGDGVGDFTVRVVKPTDANGNVKADLWIALTTTAAGRIVDEQPVNGQWGEVDTNVFDSDVVVLPVSLTALGLDPAASSARISYVAGTTGSYPAPGSQDGFVDRIGATLSFDPLAPGLWAQGGGEPALTYVAAPGAVVTVHRDEAALAQDAAESLLVLHHHNGSGTRTQVIDAR